MAKMNWTKPSAETVAYFERIAPGPPIQARSMFGMPSRFLNGHMLVSVFGDAFMLHLSEADRAECIAAGARPFAPMGRMAKEYVEIVPGHFPDQTLKEWIARGMRYLGSLPPKLESMRKQSSRNVPLPARARAEGPLSKRGESNPTGESPKSVGVKAKGASAVPASVAATPKSKSAAPKATAKPVSKVTTATKKQPKATQAKARAKTKASVKTKATAKTTRAATKRATTKTTRAATKRGVAAPKPKRAGKKAPAGRGRR